MEEARARELLARERERIEGLLANLQLEPDEDEEADPTGAGTRLEDREVDLGLADDYRATLESIERAEERLAQGTYGLSVESGKPIPDERLEAIPWAERTAEEDEHHQRHT